MTTKAITLVSIISVAVTIFTGIGTYSHFAKKSEVIPATSSGPGTIVVGSAPDMNLIPIEQSYDKDMSICISGCEVNKKAGSGPVPSSVPATNPTTTYSSSGQSASPSSFYNDAMSIINSLSAKTEPMPSFDRPPATFISPAPDPCAGIYSDSSDYGNCVDANY